MIPQAFFETIYSKVDKGYLALWTLPDRRTYWFSVGEWEEAASVALELSRRRRNVYFGVGLRREIIPPQKDKSPRGGTEDILVLPGVWIDIDILSEDAHKKDALPPDLDAAVDLVNCFPYPPSLMVHSGHGLHAYWLFKEPWVLETPKEREVAQGFLRDFQAAFIHLGLERGWEIDNTSDLARVLRVPGTLNYKGDPIEVRILGSKIPIG